MEKPFFGQTSEMGQILTKTVLFLKMSYFKKKKKDFCCFEAFSLKIDKKLLNEV